MMRLRIALITALIAMPMAASAQDNSDQETVSVSGNVAGLCILGPPSQSAVALGQLIDTSGARVGRIAAIAARQVELPGSFCNFAGTTLTVSADALLADDTAAVQAGFARAVNFASTVTNWTNPDASVTTAATAGGATPNAQGTGGTQPAPRLADLTLTLDNFTAPSDLLLVSGGYAGAVTITLGPAATPAGD